MSRIDSAGNWRANRGQLLLIGAVVLAFTILTVVVILNATIYAQSVSPDDAIEDIKDLETYERIVETDVQRLVWQVIDGEDRIEKDAFDASLENYSKRMAEQTVERKPVYVDAELNETRSDHLVRITHDNESADNRFWPANETGADEPWTVIENGSEFEAFDVRLDEMSSGQQFIVRVTETDGAEWSLAVEYTNPDEFTIDTSSGSCSTSESARIDVVAGTVNDSDCFTPPELDGSRAVEFENGHHVQDGEYTITAAVDLDGIDEDDFHDDPDDGSPYYEWYLTTAAIDVRYETGDLSSTSSIEVDVEEVSAES